MVKTLGGSPGGSPKWKNSI